MMIKILQISTVAMFVIMIIIGIIILFVANEKIDDYLKLVNGIFPVFLAQVIPALIGTPLTEAVRNMTGKKEVKDV